MSRCQGSINNQVVPGWIVVALIKRVFPIRYDLIHSINKLFYYSNNITSTQISKNTVVGKNTIVLS